VLVWDAKNEWSVRYGCRRVDDLRELAQCCKPGAPVERIAFVPMFLGWETFELFCRLAFVWLRAARGALIVEELADVTTPQKAPAGWGRILRQGLAYGPTIYALTVRPAESDKTVLSQCSLLHCHRMSSADDEKYMAKHLRCDVAGVAQLRPLYWIERDNLKLETRFGGPVKIRPIRCA